MGRAKKKLDGHLAELTEGLDSLLWPHLRTIRHFVVDPSMITGR